MGDGVERPGEKTLLPLMIGRRGGVFAQGFCPGKPLETSPFSLDPLWDFGSFCGVVAAVFVSTRGLSRNGDHLVQSLLGHPRDKLADLLLFLVEYTAEVHGVDPDSRDIVLFDHIASRSSGCDK